MMYIFNLAIVAGMKLWKFFTWILSFGKEDRANMNGGIISKGDKNKNFLVDGNVNDHSFKNKQLFLINSTQNFYNQPHPQPHSFTPHENPHQIENVEAELLENTNIKPNYLRDMDKAAKAKDIDKVQEAARKWLKDKTKKYDDEDIEGFKYGFLAWLGYNHLVPELEALKKDNPSWVTPSLQLSNYYLALSSPMIAEVHVEETLLRAANNPHNLCHAFNNYAELLFKKNNSVDEAISYLEKNVTDERLKERAVFVYQRIAELKEKKGDIPGKHYNLEKVLQIDPNDKDIRFHLAVGYSNQKNQEFHALNHYKKLLSIEPCHTGAMNNIAITLDELGLNYKKDYYLKKSIELGDSLSKGNMIRELTGKGFFGHAQKMYDEIPNNQKSDESVIDAITFLRRRVEEEKQKDNTLKGAEDIYSKYNENYNTGKFKPLSLDHVRGTWKEKNGTKMYLKINHNNNTVSGKHEGIDQIKSSIEGSVHYDKLILAAALSEEKQHYTLYLETSEKLVGIQWVDKLYPIEVTFHKE